MCVEEAWWKRSTLLAATLASLLGLLVKINHSWVNQIWCWCWAEFLPLLSEVSLAS